MISRKILILAVAFILLGCAAQPTKITTPYFIATLAPVASLTTSPSFLDFDHPRLHEIAGGKPLIIDDIVRTNRDNFAFVGVVVETGDPMENNEMLLFRVKDNVSTLIYDLGPYPYISFEIQTENHPDWLAKENFLFIRSGLTFPVHISNGGNCYMCSNLVLLEASESGMAKDTTPNSDFVTKGFVMTSMKGRSNLVDIVAVQYYEFDYGAISHSNSPFAFRLYRWDNNQYVDVSKEETEFYDEKIKELVDIIQNTYGAPFKSWITPLLSEIFFHYESSGRVELGWQQIQKNGDLSHWDAQNTQPEDIQNYHKTFEQLKKRYEADLLTPTPSTP